MSDGRARGYVLAYEVITYKGRAAKSKAALGKAGPSLKELERASFSPLPTYSLGSSSSVLRPTTSLRLAAQHSHTASPTNV